MRFALCVLFTLLAPVAIAQQEDPFANPEIGEDVSLLPDAVQATRERLIEATRSGDIESLRAIIEAQDGPPNVSFGLPDDPVDHLRSQSLDPEGLQMLAMLRNLLEMPYAVIGATTDTPNYIWPYLAALDPDELTPEQLVDAYRIVTPDELTSMRAFGGWSYWRVYIGPDGEWQAFVAGD